MQWGWGKKRKSRNEVNGTLMMEMLRRRNINVCTGLPMVVQTCRFYAILTLHEGCHTKKLFGCLVCR